MIFPDSISPFAKQGKYDKPSHTVVYRPVKNDWRDCHILVLYDRCGKTLARDNGMCYLVIWEDRTKHYAEKCYRLALYPDAKELRLNNRNLNLEKIRRKQELFKAARTYSMNFKEYLENAVKAIYITNKFMDFLSIHDFDHLLEEANDFALEHRSSQGCSQPHKITSHSPNSTGLYDSPNGSSISELERIGEFEVTQSSQEQFPPDSFDIMSPKHATIKPRLSRIYTQKFTKFKNPNAIGKIVVIVDGDGYQGRVLLKSFHWKFCKINTADDTFYLVSVIWRGNEDEYFQTRIEDIRLILQCVNRNNPGLILQINEDVSKL